jgi:threonine dehydrogenase-like Zn-dependent dehydrogenase
MAAENCDIHEGDTIAVWGCGPVGLFAIWIALKLGAGKVIAIDRVPERLRLAREHLSAETLNYEEVDIPERLKELTGGRSPDAYIDAVGSEAHRVSMDHWVDMVKEKMLLATDRGHVLRQAIYSCRKGGMVSVPGVYGGALMKSRSDRHSVKLCRFAWGRRTFISICLGCSITYLTMRSTRHFLSHTACRLRRQQTCIGSFRTKKPIASRLCFPHRSNTETA